MKKHHSKKQPPQPAAPPPPRNEIWLTLKTAAQMSGLGFYLVAVVGVCVYLGMLADDYFTLDGRGRLIGILLGFPVAIFSLWKKFRNGA